MPTQTQEELSRQIAERGVAAEPPLVASDATDSCMVNAYPDNGLSTTSYAVVRTRAWETFGCNDCGHIFAGESQHVNPRNRGICQRCNTRYSPCEGCSIRTLNAYLTDGLCDDCYVAPDDDADSTGTIIHDYSYRPPTRFFRGVSEAVSVPGLYAGMEIEFQRVKGYSSVEAAVVGAGLADNSLWYAKWDSSVDVEIVSHPATMAYWRSADFSWADAMVTAGYRSYDASNCGHHIHVSKAALSVMDRFKLLRFFKVHHLYIKRLSRRERGKLSRFARIDTCSDDFALESLAHNGNSHGTRYRAINLENLNTVEFRIFRGTAKRSSILRNLGFVVALCNYVKVTPVDLLSVKSFHKYIRSDGVRLLGEEIATNLVAWCIKRQDDKASEL